MSANPTPLALRAALRVVDGAARLAPATERASLRGEWRAELWHRAGRLQRECLWTPAEAARLLLRSFGSVADALDLRFCGPDGAADPWVEGVRAGRRLAGFAAALLCAALAVSVAAFACALASVLVAAGGPPAWGRIDAVSRAFILAIGGLWSVGLVAGSAIAAYRFLPSSARTRPDTRRMLAACGVLGLILGLLAASRVASAAAPHSVLASAALPARTALACLAMWCASAAAFAALRRWPASLPGTHPVRNTAPH
jgi:hypothetical protein